MVMSELWGSPLVWGTADAKADYFWIPWCCIFILIEEEFQFWFWFFFLVEYFLLGFLCLKAHLTGKDAPRCVPVRIVLVHGPLFWQWLPWKKTLQYFYCLSCLWHQCTSSPSLQVTLQMSSGSSSTRAWQQWKTEVVFPEKTGIGMDGYEEERLTRKTWLTWKRPSAGFLPRCRETNVAAGWEGETGKVTSRHRCHWLCYGKARQPL